MSVMRGFVGYWEAGVLSYQELASHQDDDTAIDHAGLSIKRGDLVLDLLEGKALSC